MNSFPLKPLAIDAYRVATWPVRAAVKSSARRTGLMPVAILFYHRVADDHPNPWTIGQDAFRQQIGWLQDQFDIVSLEEAQRRIRSGFNNEPTLCITFDDGYADNSTFALPLLIQRQIPFTYFVTTTHIATGQTFAHDTERGTPLAPNSIETIKALADAGVEIGGHTRNHVDLGAIRNSDLLFDEVIAASNEMGQMIGRPIRYFAFPFGQPENLNTEVFSLARRHGFAGVCSAYGGWNEIGGDAFHLRRFHGDPEIATLKNWLTLDPRKRNRRADPPTGKLRVMFLITSMETGGAEVLLVSLMRGMDSDRFAPELACLKEKGELGEELTGEFPVHSRLIRHKFDASVLGRLSRLMKERRIDALVTVGAGDKMFWGRLAARRAGVPVILSALHSTGWPDDIGRLNRMLTPITDAFIAVARPHREYLIREKRLPESRVRLIPNGIDTERFVPDAEARRQWRHRLGICDDAPVCGIVAALRPEKNHELFLNVAREVLNSIPRAHFVVVGDGVERERLEELARKVDGGDCGSALFCERLHFTGTQRDVPGLLAAMDLFALTSHNEASPVSILEAMSCELPVVAPRVGSIDQAVIDGVTGYVVPPGSRAAHVDCWIQLMGSRELRRALGEAGRRHVVQYGSIATMTGGYMQLIEEVWRRKQL